MNKREIEKYKQGLLEAIEFYSNEHKSDRELWVVSKFLTNLQINFSKKELKPAPDDPPDILYNNANFEIKEIMDKDRKRHEEYRNALKKCDSIEKIEELLGFYTPKDITIQEIIDRSIIELSKYQHKYSLKSKSKLDLLFYFNLIDFYLTDERNYKIPDNLSNYGWRSISVLRNELSCIHYASNSAPKFLKDFEGKVFFKQ